MCDVTRATLVRKLRFSTLRALSDLLDPQETWRNVMMDISGTTGEPRYSQLHIRRFEAAVLQGKSPTMEMLFDWGTTNCTVGDLVEILVRHQLFAAVSVLLPEDQICHTKAAQREEVRLSACPEVPKPVQQETRVMEPDSSTGPEENTWSSSEGLYITTSDSRCPSVPEPLSHSGFHTFSHRELTVITSDWDDRPLVDGGCRLGSGGFGVVFRGRIGDTYVAVKKLNPMDDGSLEDMKTQFNQEIQTLRSLKHEHLVELLGSSSEGQHMCLVYSFMPQGSLLDRLACSGGSPPLSWRSRCWISTGSARGLQFLHQNNHIHRDVKSANILLDEGLVAKISDFGLTRASAKQSCSTVMTERIVGTTAYMAQEALRGEITPKSDIFSFGVVLLEVLSGLPPVDESRDPKLLMEMKDEIEDDEVSLQDFIDSKMEGWQMEDVEKMYDVASQCLCEKKNRRPTITQVLSELEDLHLKLSQSSG
ncbi:interleukin-1 receptor-associated kinase 4 isoform X2 [Pimephales promelas]|uniref:interleukin-1 receptor-associated kinase 4 isoform X2 n=1 Tax=Pimephales promelas TaxID=90988 RepID=UPI001955BA0B|nr:interleukin-1 receptor-associated kinase 4 isoform X2 [Pimephales promelas]KAG1938326.1 interleukin-1 receptor-associated kinase [Pimephales promelas]